MMCHGPSVLDDMRDDVLAEVVARVRIGGVAPELVEQEFRLEHVDAHAGERCVGPARHRGRVGRLLQERPDVVVVVDMHDAEAGRLAAWHLEAADRDVRPLLDVLAQHQLVVHLVDVVAGEQHDEARVVALDDVDVLIDGVRRADIPLLLGDALACRQDVEALVALGAEEVPAHLQVPDQAVRLVLRGDRDAADARVHRIGQREIDDARLAAEIDRRLGAPAGQLHQPAAAPAGEHEGECGTREGLVPHGLHGVLPGEDAQMSQILSAVRTPPASI